MIKKLIADLRGVDKNIWGLYTFRRDPLNNKVSYEEKIDMIEKANQCGMEEALQIKSKYGFKSVREYADILGLTVLSAEEGNTEDYILFAKFNSPNKISICRRNLKKAEELVKEENIEGLIDEIRIEDVLIAHEMFHFIESKNNDIYTKRTKVRLWKLGPIKYTSGLITLGEIAAMAFAKELLQLSYYPNLFDILLLYPQDKSRAKTLYDEISAMKGVDSNA